MGKSHNYHEFVLESGISKRKEKTFTRLIQTGESFSLRLESAFSTMDWSVPCVNKAKAAASGRESLSKPSANDDER